MMISKEIRSYAYELVVNKKVSYSILSDEEKCILTGLIIKDCKSVHAHEYVTESDLYSDIPYALADYMVSFDKLPDEQEITSQRLLDLMVKKSYEYAAKEIDNILKEMEEQYLQDKKFYKDE